MKSDIIEQEEKNWLESAVIVLRHDDRTAMHDKLDIGRPWKKSLVRHSYLKPIIFKYIQEDADNSIFSKFATVDIF